MPRTNFSISYTNKMNYAKTCHPEMYETMEKVLDLNHCADRKYLSSISQENLCAETIQNLRAETIQTERKYYLVWNCIFENYKKRKSEIKALNANKNKLPDFKYEIDDLVYIFLDPKKLLHVVRSRCKGEFYNIYNIYCPSDGIDINMEENTIGLIVTDPTDKVENMRAELIPDWK